ncbi:NAD(P)/FAD-dependent oxidoreductase [Nocardioides bigeumensis]|uniref:FAD/NAD(P)-binding oxidoreductase n=1 Tax=Nocardioides bigeumensis TaxID=433657 RepID=A0ABN2YUS9_9ACTN
MGVVVVGGSLAGLGTVLALRRRGFEGEVTLLGEETERPYDRPPLSKEFLEPGAETPYLVKDGELEEQGVTFLPGTRATALDPDRRRVRLEGGEALAYDAVVIATGAQPRTLPVPGGDLPGVRTLRSLDDARALRDALDASPRVVVIGGGFIGAEFACAARARGLDVTILEREREPFALSLGEAVGRELGQLHRAKGATVRTGAGIVALEGADRVEAVILDDGTRIPADLVLVGVGVTPRTAWLDGSGVSVGNGVVCDAALRSVSHEGVYAAGDVAFWPHPLLGAPVRIEHWTNANEHGDLVAAGITGTAPSADMPPYVWSDQLGFKIQVIGRAAPTDDVRLFHRDGRIHAALWSRDGALISALSLDTPRLHLRARKAIVAGDPVDDFVAEQAALLL